MRLLKIARRPAAYWQALYAETPEAARLDFAAQKRRLCADFYGPVDIWETYLCRAGHDATDLLTGIAPLDAAWRNETGSTAEGFALTLEQVAAHGPDVLVLEAIQSWSVAEIEALREKLPRGGVVLGVTGTDIRHLPQLRMVDCVMTCMKGLVADLAREGRNAVLLPWWFDRRVLDALGPRAGALRPLTFVGGLDPGPHMHDDRLRLLRRLAGTVEIDIHAPVETRLTRILARYLPTSAAFYAARLATGLGVPRDRLPGRLGKAASWERPPLFFYDSALFPRIRPSAFGIRMFRLLAGGRATLNMHASLADRFAANMRMFEATGAGTCLLTDWKEDLAAYFAEDEVVSYRSLDEAVEKARFLAENPAAAEAIAARGQARTLRDHGFSERIPIVLEAVERARSGARS